MGVSVEQYRTNLTGLKANELKSLLISPSFQLLTDLGLTKDWQEARQKILASIPSTLQKNPHDIWNRIHVDTTAWRQSPEKIESFKILQHAIWDERNYKLNMNGQMGNILSKLLAR